jgi:heme ABC exporter ATP-binding subunit CcmA
MSLLELRGISKEYHGKRALKDVSLDVREGERLVLFGPNGAGKTTLIKIMSGIMAPAAGEILYQGAPRRDGSLKRDVFFLGHRNALYESLTVRENIDFIRRLFSPVLNGSAPSTDELLREHGLLEKGDEPVRELSQGMKRRVAIAKGFLTGQRIFILDEPFSGLDLRWRRSVQEKIGELKGRGKSLVLCTHLVEEGHALADRVAFLDRGRLLRLAAKEDLDVPGVHELFRKAGGEAQG